MVTTAAAAAAAAPSPQSRIRDNQRRSRARRKEYLNELETKYRTCEQIGAEASAEIQAAARKVADENRRLRNLLLAHGISDPDLSRSQVPEKRDVPLSDDAKSLGAMLNTRWACGDSDLRQCSAPPTSLRVPLPRSPAEDPNLRSLASYPDSGAPPQQTQQQLWPAQPATQSCGSRCGPTTSRTPSLHTPISPLPTYRLQQGDEQHYQLQQSEEQQHYYLPPSNNNNSDQHQYSHSSHLQYREPQYHEEPSSHDHQQQHQYDPQHHHHQQQYNADGTSCYAVASMIRSMNPHLGAELEAELGCGDGRECDVSNLRAFEVLDRMSGGS